jgi:hypothetical protein
MGVVYKARQTALDRVVALKMILAGEHAGGEQRERFLAEAKAIAAVKHPGIVEVHDLGTQSGLPYFALEFCPGGSLAQKLASGPLPPVEAACLLEQLARAMQAAHEQGIIHRDLKPANVLLGEDNLPRIADFGLARQVEGGGLTKTGAVVGTPPYMAPEQAQGHRDLDARADVYALGAILYEGLTGRPPFRAATVMDTLMQVVSQEPVPPSRLTPTTSRDLETICLKCLQKDPRRRYPSARALGDDLQRFLAGAPIEARPVGAWEKGWKWARRHPAQALLVVSTGAAAAAALILVAGALFYSRLQEAYDESESNRQKAVAAREEVDGQRQEAQKQTQKADTLLHLMRIERANSAWREEDVLRLEQILQSCVEQYRSWEWRYLARLARHDLVPIAGHSNGVTSLTLSREGGASRRGASAAMS